MKSINKGTTQPREYWEAFEDAADAANLSLSEWIGNAALAALPPSVAAALPDRPKVGHSNRPTATAAKQDDADTILARSIDRRQQARARRRAARNAE